MESIVIHGFSGFSQPKNMAVIGYGPGYFLKAPVDSPKKPSIAP
jgi:hypothetical protein